MEEIRKCSKHGLTIHVLDSTGRWRCRKCRVEAVQRRRDKIKKMAVQYKGSKCCICGYNRYIGALEFHYLDPNQKDFGIGIKDILEVLIRLRKNLISVYVYVLTVIEKSMQAS